LEAKKARVFLHANIPLDKNSQKTKRLLSLEWTLESALRTGSHQLDSLETFDGTPTERFQSQPRYLKIVGKSINSGNRVAKSQLQLFL
jgi:hypothetical protein